MNLILSDEKHYENWKALDAKGAVERSFFRLFEEADDAPNEFVVIRDGWRVGLKSLDDRLVSVVGIRQGSEIYTFEREASEGAITASANNFNLKLGTQFQIAAGIALAKNVIWEPIYQEAAQAA